MSSYGRHDRRLRRAEHGEEGVAFRVDLNALMLADRLANDGGVALQHALIVPAESLEQARRSLDVGEEESHGADGEPRRHEAIMRHEERVVRAGAP